MFNPSRNLTILCLIFGLTKNLCAQTPQPSAPDKIASDSWTRYVRGFRKSHHFSMTSGISQNKWNLSKFSAGAGNEEANELLLKFKYSFHIPWRSKTGFFLGTSMGVRVEADDKQLIHKSQMGYLYPGLLAGVIYNFNSSQRLWLSYERYLERADPIEIRSPTLSTNLGTTLTAQDVGLGFDYFYALRWAISFEFHYNYTKHYEPKSSESGTNPLNNEFSRQGYWAGLGVIFHHL